MLGSKNPVHCAFISLAIWLELYLTTQQQNLSPFVFDFSGDFTVPSGGDKTNDFVANTLRDKVYNSDQFIADRDGPLGSHSNRKWSATRARACGATRDERDYRGRWKRDCRVSDCYDGDLLYPDAKVASFLCVGGPCKYCIKPNSPVTEDWILEHVVPCIANSTYGVAIAKLLGKSLLWAIFSDKSHWVPQFIVDRAKAAYNNLFDEEATVNPIEKQLLVVTGDDAVLTIAPIPNVVNPQHYAPAKHHGGVAADGELLATTGAGPQHFEAQSTRQLIHTVTIQNNNLQTTINTLAEERRADRVMLMSQFRILHTNMRRIANQPIRMLHQAAVQENNIQNNNAIGGGGGGGGNAGTVGPPPPGNATLSGTPRTLNQLLLLYTK